jgi:hypothetical protein
MELVTLDITEEDIAVTFTTNGVPGPQGIQGIQGPKGDSFKYSDFTVDQLASLKGAKGDSIKGDQGIQGVKGDRGLQGIQGIQGNPLLYSDLTDANKDDLRTPLQELHDTTLDATTSFVVGISTNLLHTQALFVTLQESL